MVLNGKFGVAVRPVQFCRRRHSDIENGVGITRTTPTLDYNGNADKWVYTGGHSSGFFEGHCNFYEKVDGVHDKNWNEIYPFFNVNMIKFLAYSNESSSWNDVEKHDDFDDWYMKAKYGVRLDDALNVLPADWDYEVYGNGSGGLLTADHYTHITALFANNTMIDVERLLSDYSGDITQTFISGVAVRFEWGGLDLVWPAAFVQGLQITVIPYWRM